MTYRKLSHANRTQKSSACLSHLLKPWGHYQGQGLFLDSVSGAYCGLGPATYIDATSRVVYLSVISDRLRT